MSQRARALQEIESREPNEPPQLTAIFEELDREACDCFFRVQEIMHRAHEQQPEEPRTGTASARG
jgi:hypothetical protein